jgi:hypothetical protein
MIVYIAMEYLIDQKEPRNGDMSTVNVTDLRYKIYFNLPGQNACLKRWTFSLLFGQNEKAWMY